jgi:hypothetical protein
VPALLRGLVHDAELVGAASGRRSSAAGSPSGGAPLPEAIKEHRRHRAAWYAGLVGPLLVPASAAAQLGELVEPGERLAVGLFADTGLAGLRAALAAAPPGVGHVEVAVAKRGEDPLPGVNALLDLLDDQAGLPGYAEIPLTFGLLSALDAVSDARADGVAVSAKFRTGGLAAELFPTPIELAAVICACRDRQVPFKLTAGLHHAIRHTDPETGFIHHGFLNVLVATAQAVQGAEVADVAATLAGTDPVSLLEGTRRILDEPRELWDGYGCCSIPEPVGDLARLGLLPGHNL